MKISNQKPTVRRTVILAAAGVLAFIGARIYAQTAAPPVVHKDIPYSIVEGKVLHLDVYEPLVSNAPLPVVICVHGGGWCSGDKHEMTDMATNLARLRYCAVSVDYRLAPKFHFPDQIVDVKTAIQYIKKHAREYNADVTRIGIIGGSAGGHLALLVGLTNADANSLQPATRSEPSLVQAAISMAGPTDLTQKLPAISLGLVEGLLGKKRSAEPVAFAQASPVNYIGPDAAPMLLAHGDADEIVPYDQATEMVARCKQANAEVRLVTTHNGRHAGGGDPKEIEANVKVMLDFFAKYLNN